MTDCGAVATQILTAFNARDFAAVAPLLHPSYEATWPHARLDLHHALLQEAAMLNGFPDLRFDIVAGGKECDTIAIVETRVQATHAGELRLPQAIVVPPTGRRVDFPLQFVMLFEDGLLRLETVTFDPLTMLSQLGALTELCPATPVL